MENAFVPTVAVDVTSLLLFIAALSVGRELGDRNRSQNSNDCDNYKKFDKCKPGFAP